MSRSNGLLDQHGEPIAPRRTARPLSPNAAYYQAIYASRTRMRRPYVVADWLATSNSGQRNLLIAAARDLAINVGEARTIVDALSNFSIGNGLKARSVCPNEKIARQIDEYFTEWAVEADVTSGCSFAQCQRIVSDGITIDGDVAVLNVIDYTGHNKIQLIESPQIQTPDNLREADGQRIIEGIEFDSSGNRIAYHVRSRGFGGYRSTKETYRRIPARNCRLIFSPQRTSQYRGVSALAHGINDLHDLSETMAAMKMLVKTQAGIAMVIKNEGGVVNPDEDPVFAAQEHETIQDTEDNQPMDFNSVGIGMVPRLRMNEDIIDLKSDRPSEEFLAFVDRLIARVCGGVGVPMEILFPSRGGSPTGPAMRALLARAMACFQARAELIETKFCRPVFQWIIGDAINRGIIPETPGWDRVKFIHPKKLSIDAARDAHQAIAEWKAGMNTLENDASSRGLEWRAVQDQRKQEAERTLSHAIELKNKFDIDMGTALAMLNDVAGAASNLQQTNNNKEE